MADIKLAMSRKPPPNPYKLERPALSPDGAQAALAVSFYGHYPHLVLYDIEQDTLRVVEKPDDEGWRSPSFSPSGSTLAFIRYCMTCRDKGFHLSTYDVKTGRRTTLAGGSDLHRERPIYSPSGRFVVYGTKKIQWNGDTPEVIGRTGGFHVFPFSTNVELRVSLERFGVRSFLFASPSGFLNEHTLVFKGLGPADFRHPDRGALFRKLESLVGEQDAKVGWYGYRLGLFERGELEFISPDASRELAELRSLTVSADTGQMAYIGKSYRPAHISAFIGYDIFIGGGETEAFRQATSLHTHMAHLGFSKSGNRVAFLADGTRKQHWSLWILEVETGRVWETNLKRRLQDWYRFLSER